MGDPQGTPHTVTVFGSGSAHEGDEEFRRAEQLGKALAERGLALCNGGYGGTMLAAARAARLAGGTAIGVTLSGSAPNPRITREIPCGSLVERISSTRCDPLFFSIRPCRRN